MYLNEFDGIRAGAKPMLKRTGNPSAQRAAKVMRDYYRELTGNPYWLSNVYVPPYSGGSRFERRY